MSFFNTPGPRHHYGDEIIGSGLADTRYAHSDPHDPETGRGCSFHSPGQRRSFLARNPQIDPASLPPVTDPNFRLPLDNCHTIDGMPADLRRKYHGLERNAALLKDPAATTRYLEPTKPTLSEPSKSLYRTGIHESGHALMCFVHEVPIARISVAGDGNLNGYVKHADMPDNQEQLEIMLGGEAAEIVVFGTARQAGLHGDRKNAQELASRLRSGRSSDELIEKAREATVRMLRGEEHTLRYLAYDLIRQKTIDFDDVEIALDKAFTASERYAAERVRRANPTPRRGVQDERLQRLMSETHYRAGVIL